MPVTREPEASNCCTGRGKFRLLVPFPQIISDFNEAFNKWANKRRILISKAPSVYLGDRGKKKTLSGGWQVRRDDLGRVTDLKPTNYTAWSPTGRINLMYRSSISWLAPMFSNCPSSVHGTGPVWLFDVRCQGNESSLDQCRHAEWGSGQHACSDHASDVCLVCYNPQYQNSGETSLRVGWKHQNSEWRCTHWFTQISINEPGKIREAESRCNARERLILQSSLQMLCLLNSLSHAVWS